MAQGALAANWLVRAQAIGAASDGNYGFCGSSDGAVNCSSVSGSASGDVIYAAGDTKIAVQAKALGQANPAAVAGGHVTADLSTVTIRQANSNMFGSSSTTGHIADQLVFDLADPNAVYAIPFSYSFDGTLSGDTFGEFHPGMYAQSSLQLGSGSIGSNQSIGESGPAYYPPSVALSNGAGDWIGVVITPSQYGYSVSGDVLVGGGWGDTLAFDMQSQVSCANEYGLASCDFSHTQAFTFGQLPTGATYASASGVFLAGDTTGAGAPEPSTWALMITGLGLIGAAARTARRRAPSASRARAWSRRARRAALPA